MHPERHLGVDARGQRWVVVFVSFSARRTPHRRPCSSCSKSLALGGLPHCAPSQPWTRAEGWLRCWGHSWEWLRLQRGCRTTAVSDREGAAGLGSARPSPLCAGGQGLGGSQVPGDQASQALRGLSLSCPVQGVIPARFAAKEMGPRLVEVASHAGAERAGGCPSPSVTSSGPSRAPGG